MKKIFPAVFALFCVAVCLVPSLGMIVRPTTEPIGNERKSKAPELTYRRCDGSGRAVSKFKHRNRDRRNRGPALLHL